MHKRIKKSIAKINLGLLITEKRSDGFHNLETIFYPIHDLFDLMKFEKSTEYLFISNTDLKFDEDNLIYKAVKILENEVNEKLPVTIELEKKIPIGGGLGGGSSNAASTLMELNQLFHLQLSDSTLKKLALMLGSDVPYFLNSKPALAKGRGEILMPLDLRIKGIILIVNPNIHISTKEVFSKVKPQNRSILVSQLNDKDNFRCEKARNILINDFEQIVFEEYPEIEEIKRKMIEHEAKLAMMSGTGSTVFGVFETIEKALECSATFPGKYQKFVSYDHG